MNCAGRRSRVCTPFKLGFAWKAFLIAFSKPFETPRPKITLSRLQGRMITPSDSQGIPCDLAKTHCNLQRDSPSFRLLFLMLQPALSDSMRISAAAADTESSSASSSSSSSSSVCL
eukprot:TRINITY_DN12365_c0_g1_i2.p1 TRINITY_DN12365_c0_g1~~TRINITY_DN12365_c0_g1_i2.p1  ORF type:complete len:116 (-),score=1.52 TRINITY_DN12365_c0_g1_i2:92-439(-)